MRHSLRDAALQHLHDQRSGVAPRTANHATITNAFIGGDTEVIQAAAEHAESMLPVMEQRLKLKDARDTANYLNLVAAATSLGVVPEPRLERLLKIKASSDPKTKVLRWVAERILDDKIQPPRLRKSPEWLSRITQVSSEDALDLMLIPDHKDWVVMRAFVLPLALLLGLKSASSMEIYARVGGHPERRGEEFYVRTLPRPSLDLTITETDPTTWPGFDAVERKDGQLLVYHYFDQRWLAPIVFQPDLDGLPFLRHIGLSWKLVEEAVPKEKWESIRADIDVGRVKHILAYDRTQTFVAKGALQNASREYGITIEAADFMAL